MSIRFLLIFMYMEVDVFTPMDMYTYMYIFTLILYIPHTVVRNKWIIVQYL